MTYDYILSRDTDEPFCSNQSADKRAQSIEWIGWAPDYAEPGYSPAGKNGVLMGNWNNFSRRAYDLLEKAGYSCEWEDEWLTCGECGNVFRSTGDSYSWSMYGVITDGDCTCGDCVKENPAAYLESLEDNPRQCITIDGIEPADRGYVKHNGTFENGWHGRRDDPKAIMEYIHSHGGTNVIFALASVGQWDLAFTAWHRGEMVEA